MAEAKNSFIKSKMNKDLDERLIPNNEYRDALNIAVSRSEASDVGALESILGNTKVTSNEYDDAGEVIGYFVDDANSLVYYFKTDWTEVSLAPSTATCQILVYNSLLNTTNVKAEGYWLNFSTQSPVLGINLVENLLFWTDNRNQPRKINVEQPSTYYFNEDQISVAKFAPIFPPEYLNLRAPLINNYSPELDTYPSTMTNAADPDTVPVGVYEVSDSNLAVTRYRNGDPIVEAQTLASWQAADTGQYGAFCYYDEYIGNEVTYGVLYNKYAVMDSRGLAPIGFTIPTTVQWNGIIGAGGATSNLFKSTTLWDNPPQANTNANGMNVKPGGWRQAANSSQDFRELTTRARFWTSDAITTNNLYVNFSNTNALPVTTLTSPASYGMSVRVIKEAGYNGWNGDPELLKDKFVRFSYRFKFDDNEYSIVAPFSQDVFIPEHQGKFINDDETQAFITTVVEFMQNSINNAVLNIKLPCIDIINNYKIKAIEIIYKESDKQAYQILEKVDVDATFISSLNYTNVYQYNYQSKQPIKTMPQSETTRVFDKVPVRALAQESSGNRILYSNYVESYTAPLGLDYYTSVADKSTQQFIEYPQHSLKQNRNYQVGIVLADKFGRQTDIVLSNYDGLLDVNGDPQPGSNVFSDYNTLQFNGNVLNWPGDTLSVNYLQPIPENSLTSGYPGSYAQGEYYAVNIEDGTSGTGTGALYPFFQSESYQYFTANTTTLTTTFFAYSIKAVDFQNNANTLNVYVNEGNGWILKTLNSDYTASVSLAHVNVVFAAAITPGFNVKVELLFGPNRYYQYKLGSAGVRSDGTGLMFDNFPTNYDRCFSVGRKMSGQYIDYTNIVTVTPSSLTPIYNITIQTKEEIDVKYLFSNTPDLQQPEPTLSSNMTRATYDINVNGFYTYKFGVKQQQQDYYNVYLPGIVNGYPIKASTLEEGETGFITLISDNINKVPRNLQDVGPLQDQFTSDETMFPRVTNIVPVVVNSFSTQTKQFDPAFSPDSVDLVGTIKDVFPLLTGEGSTPPIPTAAGEVNPYSIYNFNTKPYVAKLSTRKPVGLDEQLYTIPTGSNPYPANLGLAVYETSPFVSQLELFYETSSAQLISDLNVDIQNESGDINGSTFSSVSVSFSENDVIGSTITGNFFPTSGGQLVTSASCSIVNIFSYNPTTQAIDTNIDYISRFSLVAVGNGSFNIATAQGTNDPNGFFAGGSNSNLYDVTWRGKFEVNLRWSLGGVDTFETVTLQLQNDPPVIINTLPPFTVPNTGGLIVGMYPNASARSLSPLGLNGSAITSGVGYPTNGDSATFSSNNGWDIVGARYVNNSGTTTYWGVYPGNSGTSGNISDFASIVYQANVTASPGVSPTKYRQFVCSGNSTTGNYHQVGSYSLYFSLTDDVGAVTYTYMSYTVGAANYTGQVVYASYTQGNPSPAYAGTQSDISLNTITSSTNLPIWQGQIQNWTANDIGIWVASSKQNPGFCDVKAIIDNPLSYPDGTLGSGTNTVGGYFVQSQTSTGLNQNTGFTGSFQQVAQLQGLSRTSTQITEGVSPGEKNPTPTTNTGTYNFQPSAAVNLRIEMIRNQNWPGVPPTGYAGAIVTYLPAGQTPTINNPGTNLTEVIMADPPFYPRGGTGITDPTVFPTVVPSGGFVGP